MATKMKIAVALLCLRSIFDRAKDYGRSNAVVDL